MTIKLEATFCVVPLLFVLAGCVPWRDAKGTRHMLIVGVGIVSQNVVRPDAATVVSANVLGLAANGRGLTAGLSSEFVTSVPTNASDVRIEASRSAVGVINIEVQKAELRTKSNKPYDYK